MRRLGYLARHAFTTHSGVLDAQQYTAALPVCARGAELCIASRRYLRRMCCTFLILMRTLHVARESVLAADLPPIPKDLLPLLEEDRIPIEYSIIIND